MSLVSASLNHSLLLFGSERKLVATGNTLDDDVLRLDALLLELCNAAVNETVDDRVVPPSVHDQDTKRRAIVLLGGRRQPFDCWVHGR